MNTLLSPPPYITIANIPKTNAIITNTAFKDILSRVQEEIQPGMKKINIFTSEELHDNF
ncbi:hypothetical protein FRB94_002242 [Tulasnella sp. JGI-2019a]|nr:hypothetical protein FRB93_012490 [Tulasnella sp. JGI-2019a]KAG8987088.1 hypothetical protein FRB94_002242 [Tulasnella sp. JGI-2019a]KAG9021917.1 hypothetical protein FRB95_001167 [Tulasnella sp. JGI-2019a]